MRGGCRRKGGAFFSVRSPARSKAGWPPPQTAQENARLGGDWELEAGAGLAQAGHPFQEGFHYEGVLPPTRTFINPSDTIYTRPGGNSFTWVYGQYTNAALGFPGLYDVATVSYWNVPDPGFFVVSYPRQHPIRQQHGGTMDDDHGND